MGGGGGNFFTNVGNTLTGGAFAGPEKLGTGGQFKMTREAAQGEQEALQALRSQASGSSPSITGMQYSQALQQSAAQQSAQAAAARGVNPALAFRAAADANAAAQAQAAGQSALMAEEERRAAQQALIQAAAGQRGVALQGAQANLQSRIQNRGQTFDLIGNLGGAAAKAASGGAK